MKDLCERSVWRPGAWVSQRWWEQEGVDLGGGARERAEATMDGEEEKRGEEADREETMGRS